MNHKECMITELENTHILCTSNMNKLKITQTINYDLKRSNMQKLYLAKLLFISSQVNDPHNLPWSIISSM